MTHFPWSLKGVVLSVAVVTLLSVGAAISIGLAYPEPVSSGALGPDWQCTRMALVFTSCTRVARAEPATTVAATDPLCRRGTAWRSASTSR
jgi:hypothetical protein